MLTEETKATLLRPAQGTIIKSFMQTALEAFIALEPVNKTRYTEITRNVNSWVDSMEGSSSIMDGAVIEGQYKNRYEYIMASPDCTFLNELSYGRSRDILKKWKRESLRTEVAKSMWDARKQWHDLKDEVTAHGKEFKNRIITKPVKEAKPTTLREFIPAFKIPAPVAAQLEKIEKDLHDKFYGRHMEFLNGLVERYVGTLMDYKQYRKMSEDFRLALTYANDTLSKSLDFDNAAETRSQLVATGTTNFVVGRMFEKFRNINFSGKDVEFIYSTDSAYSTHFNIQIKGIVEGIAELRFTMIVNRSIYNNLFNQFPTKLYVTRDGKTAQVTHIG